MVENEIYHDINYGSIWHPRLVRTLSAVTVDGVQYYRTGEQVDGVGVFMLSAKWPHVPWSDDGLFAFVGGQMIPLPEYESSKVLPTSAGPAE